MMVGIVTVPVEIKYLGKKATFIRNILTFIFSYIKLMGEKSGFIGVTLAFFLGSAATGPLYAAFPVAGVLLKKGSKFSNVIIFIGAWSTTKIPMLLLSH